MTTRLRHCALTLVVYGDDGVVVSHLDAGSDHPVHAVLHLRVPALHSVEVKQRVSLRSTCKSFNCDVLVGWLVVMSWLVD